MRYCFILFISFLFVQATCSQNTDTFNNNIYIDLLNYPNSKVPLADSIPLKCKVFRIKKNKQAYFIDITANNQDYVYTIISLKSGPHIIDIKEDNDRYLYSIVLFKFKNEKQKSEKIKKGKWYELALFAYYPFIIVGDPMFTYYTIEGVKVGFKGDFQTGQIVTTPNLKGLYYVPN